MITAHAHPWSRARFAHHASTQLLDIDLDVEEVPAAAYGASAFEGLGPYFSQTELANLAIWAQPRRSHSGPGFPDVRPEVLPLRQPSGVFDELDALRSDDRLALQAIRHLGTTHLLYREKLAARLEDLLRAYQEDYEGRSLSAAAIEALVSFLNAYPCLKRPSLTATPSGDLYAEWTAHPDILVGARFLPSGEVQYVIFAPNPLHTGRTDRASGSTTVDALMDRVRQLRAERWLAQ